MIGQVAQSAPDYSKKTANKILDRLNGREIVCWGYNPDFVNSMKQYGIYVMRTYSSNKTLIEEQGCLPSEQLKNNSSKLFVLFPNLTSPLNIKKLLKFGYSEHDYITMYPERKEIITDGYGHFYDDFGNTVDGYAENFKIEISGYNNEIRVGEGVSIPDKMIIRINSPNNKVHIGDKCILKGDYFGDSGVLISVYGTGSSEVIIGNSCKLMKCHINTGGYAKVHIGERTTFEPDMMIQADSYTDVNIGKDCMFSSDVKLQSADGHSIFDVSTKKNINSSLRAGKDCVRHIKIGDHVWIGRRCMIIGDTDIGNGSIIGGQSVVKGVFPNNVVAAGTPAKILAKDRAWARKPMSEDINDCGIYVEETSRELSLTL